MTHWKELANYDYLGAYSLEGIAEEIVLTIKEIKVEQVTAPGGKKEDCIVAHFEEKYASGVTVKPMVLNKTNCNIITALFGTPFIENWYGKQIIVYSATTKFQRDIVPCLRVKKELPIVQAEEEYFCEVCGTKVEKKIALGLQKKYGAILCSKECLEKIKNQDKEEGEE